MTDTASKVKANMARRQTELEALSTDEREALAASVCPMWNDALSRAVILMWRACRRLGPTTTGNVRGSDWVVPVT